MLDYWAAQRQADINGMMENAGAMGAAWKQKREQKKIDANLRVEYARALAVAKNTGELPEQFQGTVSEDTMGRQAGIKVVALRELGKRAPSHPLVVSPECRKTVASVTLIQYNQADRPEEKTYDEFAPDDATAQRIFDAFAS